MVEKTVDDRISEHVNKYQLLPVFQSAYCPFHSTETAVVCIMNAMIGALDRGHIGALVLLDLSAAFDTVDYNILAEVLRKRFGMHGRTLDWIVDFLSDRRQAVSVNSGDSGDYTAIRCATGIDSQPQVFYSVC